MLDQNCMNQYEINIMYSFKTKEERFFSGLITKNWGGETITEKNEH